MRRSIPLAARLSIAVIPFCAFPAPAFAQGTKPPPPTRPKPALDTNAPNAPRAPLPPLVAPPPPPPWPSPVVATTSTSGASLLPENSPTASATTTAAPAGTGLSNDERASFENRLRLIEARLGEDANVLLNNPELSWLRKFHLSGFLQPQILIQSYNTAASPNLIGGQLPAGVGANDTIAKSNGTTTNGDTFRLRRARLRTEFDPSEGTRFVFEIDPTPPGGQIGESGTLLRTVEAVGIARWSDFVSTEFAAGIFKLPFGREVLQNDADRPFIERSWGEQNLMPGEFDTGARAYTTWSKDGRSFVAQIALVNGHTEGEPNFTLDPDLNQGKDTVGRVSFDFGDWADLGASGYFGYGQSVNASELRFKQFIRWAANGELGLHHTFSPSVGATRIFAEVTFAQNLDRGTYYSFALPVIPTDISAPVASMNERSVWARLEQDLSKWVTIGFRWDEYTPDTSQSDNARDTFGGVLVAHFTPWLQLMAEYDHAIDHVHARGTDATDKQIDVGSGVLQARF